MATVVRETERKYELADGVELPGWAGLAGVEALVGPEEQALEAVYFDTEDLRLARAGVTLRRRRGGHDAGWHLKLPVGAGTAATRSGWATRGRCAVAPRPPSWSGWSGR